MLSFLDNISPVEILIVALILIVFFGSKVVTRLARTGGETVKEIKKMKDTIAETMDDVVSDKKDK